MPSAVHVHLQLQIISDDGTVFTGCEILHLVKSHHQLEAVGLSIGESKSLQKCLQQHIVTAHLRLLSTGTAAVWPAIVS